MTKQTCCGNIEGGDSARPWPDGPSETRGAPQTTKSCYQSFDFQNCKTCCEGGGECIPTSDGGYCKEGQRSYIYKNGVQQKDMTKAMMASIRDTAWRRERSHDRSRRRGEIRELQRLDRNEDLGDEIMRRRHSRGHRRAREEDEDFSIFDTIKTAVFFVAICFAFWKLIIEKYILPHMKK